MGDFKNVDELKSWMASQSIADILIQNHAVTFFENEFVTPASFTMGFTEKELLSLGLPLGAQKIFLDKFPKRQHQQQLEPSENSKVKSLTSQPHQQEDEAETGIVQSNSADSESSDLMFRQAVSQQQTNDGAGPSDDVDIQPLEFMNREKECEELAKIFLKNRRKRDRVRQQGTFGLESQFRLTLATCAQMFGSGKSTFGCSVLVRLNEASFADRLKKIQEKNKFTDDDMNWLRNLQYVGIDLRERRWGLDFLKAFRLILFTTLVKLVSDEGRANKLAEELSHSDCKSIVLAFEKELGKSFLIHLDEFSQIDTIGGEEKHKVYYQVWGEISKIHKTNSEIFCSGRSPTIYLLGKCKFRSDFQSPEDAECIILDPLERDHVRTIFENFHMMNAEENFLGKIYQFTAGVPRFVAHAVDYFTTRLPEVSTDEAKIRRDTFLSDPSDFQQYLCDEAGNEMNSLEAVDKNQRKFYIELIRIAALRLPVDLDKEINGDEWGLKTGKVTLDVCSVYPLYLKNFKTESDARHFFLIPPAVLDNISSKCQDPRIPFWASLYKTNPIEATAQDAGSVLELMAQQCLRLRVSEELNQRGNMLEDTLEFLKGSKVADKKLTLNAINSFQEFPKITRTPQPGKPEEKLRKYFEDPKSAGFSDVHPDDLPVVYKLLKPGVFYVPRPKSSSSDLIFRTDGADSCFVEWQFKNGKQQVNRKILGEELRKSICFVAKERGAFSGVFVMVALTVGDLPTGGTKVQGQHGEVIAMRYSEFDAIHDDFLVPKGLDVIVVLEKGLLTFLTEQNIAILRRGEVTLDDISSAIKSPARKKIRTT